MENQEITAKSLFKQNAAGLGTGILLVGATALGKLIWNGYKIGILDLASVKTVAFQVGKGFGWILAAIAVGNLFGSLLPLLGCQRPNPKVGDKVGSLLGLAAMGYQVYALYSAGAAVVLPFLGYQLIGGAAIVLIIAIAVKALNTCCHST